MFVIRRVCVVTEAERKERKRRRKEKKENIKTKRRGKESQKGVGVMFVLKTHCWFLP